MIHRIDAFEKLAVLLVGVFLGCSGVLGGCGGGLCRSVLENQQRMWETVSPRGEESRAASSLLCCAVTWFLSCAPGVETNVDPCR